ncbi:response regulator [Tardiphaga alba]|uniref:histidine kinase n=2 Tax=Tardiphaga alba TaxID=340268 RepID=A0ABX8AFI7_9BRAD|nr:response regulator [Tardiphaga alba]
MFPMGDCVSGWAMLKRETVIIPDIYLDSRVPHAVYRPTFVRSMVMTPVGAPETTAAIGAYWAELWTPSEATVERLETLARCAAIAFEHVRLIGMLHESNQSLEQRVGERTAELQQQIDERDRLEDTLRQMQRLEAVGQLTSGVAHDFNNLLTVILGNLEFLQRDNGHAGDAKFGRRLANMKAAAERGAKLTAQLLAFSRRQRLEAKPIDLNDSVSNMQDLLRSSMGGSVQLELVLHPKLWPAMVDQTQLELVILNLAINARDAMQVGGALAIETANAAVGPPERPEEPAAGEYVVVSVADTGSGMSDAVLARAFEPFFTTKEVGKGSGLGLAQVYGFAKQSGGGVRIETRVGEGTVVKVYLPRVVEAAQSVSPVDAATAHELVPGSTRVLVIDDDSAVREITVSLLQQMGCKVEDAGSGGAGLDLLARSEAAFDLIVLDYAMPGMNGADVARAIAKDFPELPVLFVTGYADLTALRDIGEDRIAQKPFDQADFAAKVKRLLGVEGGGSNVVALRR